MIDDCTALILAGGDSRRMGRDKAALSLGGLSLLQRAIQTMRAIFPTVLVSVRTPRPDIDAPQVLDELPDAGPLAGLCAGLRRAQTPWVFALATDMPYLHAPLIEHLATLRGNCQAVVPKTGAHLQTLAAFYAVAALPRLDATLHGAGKCSLHGALEGLAVRYVDESTLCESTLREPTPRAAAATRQSFIDLDTPAAFAAARRHFGE
ncbi:MAG: molybdenum cofactor guanylyltransferase [Azoarcus sp.]|jgi:molybdopterin-guanine dinucleotide biosynthesis protein A|nr:molybdenum cofactor guanylyltransferase [Azoarcus sp.]